MKIKFKVLVVLFVLISSVTHGQTSLYSLDCGNLGHYKRVSYIDSLEVQTSYNSTTQNANSGTSIFTVFTHSSQNNSRQAVLLNSKTLINVYPRLVKDSYFINIEVEQNCEANIQLVDMFGRCIITEKQSLKKGLNIFEREKGNISSGQYFVKVQIANNIYVKKIVIS